MQRNWAKGAPLSTVDFDSCPEMTELAYLKSESNRAYSQKVHPNLFIF